MQSFINIGQGVAQLEVRTDKTSMMVTFHLHFEDTNFPVAITTWEPFELCPPASTEHLFRVKVCLRVSLSQQQQGHKMGLPRLLLSCVVILMVEHTLICHTLLFL